MLNNLSNRYQTKLDFKLYMGNYWDLYLNDRPTLPTMYDSIISGDTLISQFDFNNDNIYTTGSTSAHTIYSLDTWKDAVNNGVFNDSIGLTGIDNGLITFNKTSGDTGNTALLSAITGTNLTIMSGETRFVMNRVTGTTGQYTYPIGIDSEQDVGRYAKLCGGFYQGFYKLEGYDYQTLPVRYKDGWTAEFWLRKNDDNCSGHTANTLNDKYPENKGYFFFMGTRAENKFWNIFDGLNSGPCSSSTATTFCTKIKETNVKLRNLIRISPPKQNLREISNNFLLYHRANEGTFGSSCEVGENNKIPGGLASEFSGTTKPIMKLDKEGDVADNAIGFKINDDGSISYKRLSSECFGTGKTSYTAVTIQNGTTEETPIEEKKWHHVAIRFQPYQSYTNECSPDYKSDRQGKLMIYVDGKLKFVLRDFDEMYTKDLDDHHLKQVGVPHNMSIGGGTQGLIDSQTFDGPDPDDRGLFIEKNFAGSFIGDISKFRLYNNSLNWCEIQNNVDKEKDKYGLKTTINCG